MANLDSKLDRILNQLSELIPIKNDMEDMKNETRAIRSILTEEISKRSEIEEKLKNTDVKQQELENRIFELENKNQRMEKMFKEKNLLFYNTEIPFSDTLPVIKRKITQLISNTLKIPIRDEDIDFIKKFKSQKDSTTIVCVTFCSLYIKNNVLSNARLLKGTKISIRRDLTKNEIYKEKKALEYIKVLKKSGFNVKKVGLDRISLNGKIISEATVSGLITNTAKETPCDEEDQRHKEGNSFLGTNNKFEMPIQPSACEEHSSADPDGTTKKRGASSPLESQRSRTFSQSTKSKIDQNNSKKTFSQEESFLRGFLATSQSQQ